MLIPVTVRSSHEIPAPFGFDRNLGTLICRGESIEFSVKQRAAVNLSVYDATGKKASTLVNTMLAPGTYQAAINGALPGGLYFLRLQSDGISRTKRFVLEK